MSEKIKQDKDYKMGKSIAITYNITDPEMDGTSIMRMIADELRRIHDVVGDQISKVVIKCQRTDSASMPLVFKDQIELQTNLGIDEITIHNEYSGDKNGDENLHTPESILEELRRIHDELSDAITEINDDSEDASSALEQIYTELKIQLDALEDALSIS